MDTLIIEIVLYCDTASQYKTVFGNSYEYHFMKLPVNVTKNERFYMATGFVAFRNGEEQRQDKQVAAFLKQLHQLGNI